MKTAFSFKDYFKIFGNCSLITHSDSGFFTCLDISVQGKVSFLLLVQFSGHF